MVAKLGWQRQRSNVMKLFNCFDSGTARNGRKRGMRELIKMGYVCYELGVCARGKMMHKE